MSEKYIKLTPDEFERLDDVMKAEFGESSRISRGAYIRLLSRRRLDELSEEGVVVA